jgi:hypothetical protein
VPGAIKWDNAVRQTKQHSQVKYRVLCENFYDSITECEGVLELLIGQVLMAVCYICREWCVSYDSYLIFNLPISFKFLFLKSSWELRFPLETKTLKLVLAMHEKSLKTHRVDDIVHYSTDVASWYYPVELSTLIWQPRLRMQHLKPNLLFANLQTLRYLRVGPERELYCTNYVPSSAPKVASGNPQTHSTSSSFWYPPESLMMARSCTQNYTASA